jgi:hypothetical protein
MWKKKHLSDHFKMLHFYSILIIAFINSLISSTYIPKPAAKTTPSTPPAPWTPKSSNSTPHKLIFYPRKSTLHPLMPDLNSLAPKSALLTGRYIEI